MKKLFLLFVAALTLSCSADDTDPENCCTVIDSVIDIKIVDEQGNDLLIPGSDFSEIKFLTYDRREGNWVMSRNQPDVIMKEDGNYLRVFANLENKEEEISELKLEYSKTDFDIIKTRIERAKSNIIVTEVWFNDELKWDMESKTERVIEVIKN